MKRVYVRRKWITSNLTKSDKNMTCPKRRGYKKKWTTEIHATPATYFCSLRDLWSHFYVQRPIRLAGKLLMATCAGISWQARVVTWPRLAVVVIGNKNISVDSNTWYRYTCGISPNARQRPPVVKKPSPLEIFHPDFTPFSHSGCIYIPLHLPNHEREFRITGSAHYKASSLIYWSNGFMFVCDL